MKYISSFDAKTHLSHLLSEVMAGQEYVITRRNKEIARLTPFVTKDSDIEKTIASIKHNKLRTYTQVSDILEYKAHGRK